MNDYLFLFYQYNKFVSNFCLLKFKKDLIISLYLIDEGIHQEHQLDHRSECIHFFALSILIIWISMF